MKRLSANVWQMHHRAGPNWESRSLAMAEYVTRLLLDDAAVSGNTEPHAR